MKSIPKEKCGICEKFIYLHNKILICAVDNKAYHAKCLKISRDTACELQSMPDWFCPMCLGDIFPFFNLNSGDVMPEKCKSCTKFISASQHEFDYCTLCTVKCHTQCLDLSLCKPCRDDSEKFSSNPICDKHFDPYEIEEQKDHDLFFDDDIDDSFSSIQLAKDILSNCSYHATNALPLKKLENTTFYFNNIDGFKSNFHEFLANKALHNFDFDFYCFNETNIHENCIENFELDGYTLEMLHAMEGKSKGSGLAIYFRDNIKFKRINYLSLRNKHFESLGGKFQCDIGDVYVITIYRFNEKCDEEFHDIVYNKLIKHILDKPCIILGDFNLDTFKYSNSKQVQCLVDNFITYGFSPLISKATNFFKTSSTSIDHIWCNFLSHNTYSGVITESSSSHKPIFANLPTKIDDIDNTDDSSANFFTQNISAKNIEKFEKELNKLTVEYAETSENVLTDKNQAKNEFSNFYCRLKDIYDLCFVEEVDGNRTRNFVNRPWMTLAIANSCKTKNNLHNKWIDSRGKFNEAQSEHDFKVYRAKLRDVIRLQKEKYFNERFKKCNGNIKKMLESVKRNAK